MKTQHQLLIVAALVLFAALAWYVSDQRAETTAQAGSGSAAGPPAVPVEVSAAREDTVAVTVEAVGTAQANEAVVITPKVTGLVKRISFAGGEWVKAGVVLLELDSSELGANLEEKRAEHQQAQRLHDRARALLKNKNISQARVDELEAELEAAKARVRADEARLRDYVIRAPFAGRLGLRRVSVGALVNPGDIITTLDDTSRIKVDFRVPESVLAHARPGLAIQAESVSYSDVRFTGTVIKVDSRIDPVTRSVELRAEFPNPDELLKPGMFLTAKLALASRPGAVLIPEEALVSQGNEHYVFLVIEGRAVRTKVTLGQRLIGEVEALTGLQPGDQVITRGIQKIRDGVPVTPLPTAEGGDTS